MFQKLMMFFISTILVLGGGSTWSPSVQALTDKSNVSKSPEGTIEFLEDIIGTEQLAEILPDLDDIDEDSSLEDLKEETKGLLKPVLDELVIVTYLCDNKFKITNNTLIDVPYEWEGDNGEAGSGVIKANSNVTMQTESVSVHIRVIVGDIELLDEAIELGLINCSEEKNDGAETDEDNTKEDDNGSGSSKDDTKANDDVTAGDDGQQDDDNRLKSDKDRTKTNEYVIAGNDGQKIEIGGKLPQTNSSTPSFALAGLLLVLMGSTFLFIRRSILS